MVAVPGVPVVAGVLSSCGASGCRELGSLEGACPALSRGDPHQGVQQYPEPATKPAEARTTRLQSEPDRKLPIYIGVFRAFSGPAKNQSFISDNMPYKAFRGRITPNFDISL